MIYEYYEDADRWVLNPPSVVEKWSKEQYHKIKNTGNIKSFQPLKSDEYESVGGVEITIKQEDDTYILNREGQRVKVRGDLSVVIRAKIRSVDKVEEMEFRFFGDNEYPLY